MKNLFTITKATLPTVPVYNNLDIVGNTVGRYFDYKRDTKRIEHETQKVKSQAKIIVKQIDAELKKSLDHNDKNFKKEMKRLEEIGKELKSSRKSKSKILKQIDNYIMMLSDEKTSLETKAMIPNLINGAYGMLNSENNLVLKKLNLMSDFESNTKLIGGE